MRTFIAILLLFATAITMDQSESRTVSETVISPGNGGTKPPNTYGGSKFRNSMRKPFLDPAVHEYSVKHGFKESKASNALRMKTDQHERSRMMGHPNEAALFKVLLPAMDARKIIEVGVFTGYTTLIMAEAIKGKDGAKIVALDVSEEYTSIGKPFWKEADVSDVIDLRIGSASESMKKMADDANEIGTYDFVFIDADKVGYHDYYEYALKLIRTDGIIAIDNVLWGGKVTDNTVVDDDTVALRELNKFVQQDSRVEHVLIPFADGVTLVRKKQ